jgi:hypothetical protein
MKKEELIIKKLEQLSSGSNTTFLSREVIIKIANKFFTTSGFATKNKQETLSINQNERIIFGLEEGFIFTNTGFYFLTITGNTNKFKFNFDDFLKLQANHLTLTETGKLMINGNFIENESRLHPFQLDVYDKIKKAIEEAHFEYIQYCLCNPKL